jgi:hypothetical protein
MSMLDKILWTGRDNLLDVAIAAYELLSKLAKLPPGTKFEMSHEDFNALGNALSVIAEADPAPGMQPFSELPQSIMLAVGTLANAWETLSRAEDDILYAVVPLGEFDIRVAVAKNAIPEDYRRKLRAPYN